MFDVTTVGDVSIDEIVCDAGYFCGVVGGSALYPAVTVAKLGGRAAVASVVGDDFPSAIVTTLEGLGINLAGLTRVRGATTRVKVNYEGEDLRAVEVVRGVGSELRLEGIPRAYWDTRVMYFGPGPVDFLRAAIRRCRDRSDAKVAFSPKEDCPSLSDVGMRELVSAVDIVFMNEREARRTTGEADSVAAAGLVRQAGAGTVVVTQASRGSIIVSSGGVHKIRAVPADVVCPVGGGDAYLGAFLFLLAAGGTERRCGELGAKVATTMLEGVGIQAEKELRIDPARWLRQGPIRDRA